MGHRVEIAFRFIIVTLVLRKEDGNAFMNIYGQPVLSGPLNGMPGQTDHESWYSSITWQTESTDKSPACLVAERFLTSVVGNVRAINEVR
ncbi:hypothetical protein J6590_024258 [Homalodisca vitripennis]|nr:hypothetical protein J6590_024258 [Homalodisca vitripennis]